MRAAEIMHTHVVALSPKTPIEVARTQMRKRHIRHLVIVDEGHIVGILSDRDLDRMGLSADTVVDAMTSHVFSITPETTISRAARLMRDHRISCLPVMDGTRLVGILTTSDMLELLAGEPADEQADEPADEGPPAHGDPGDART